MRVDLNNGQCGTPASRRSVMTVRNSSRPIARVFRATAAPGCRDELLQRFHSSSAALVNSKVGCPKYPILEPVDASAPELVFESIWRDLDETAPLTGCRPVAAGRSPIDLRNAAIGSPNAALASLPLYACSPHCPSGQLARRPAFLSVKES